MKTILLLIILTMSFVLAKPAMAQDSTKKVRPTHILKLSVGNPMMYLLYPRFGIKYVCVGYERFRKNKHSFNYYLDYYAIQDGSYNSPGMDFFSWNLDNYGAKNIVSFRTLYKWYPLHKIKFVKGFYIAGGINGALKYTHKKIVEDYGEFEYRQLDLYVGLGLGIGYRIEFFQKLSLEVFYHTARNGVSWYTPIIVDDYNPIGIDLLDFSIGYVLSPKTKNQ
jgi:hypothetical protein